MSPYRQRRTRGAARDGGPEDLEGGRFPMQELDNPVWFALTGPQRHLGVALDHSARFRSDVAPFGAFSAPPIEAHWAELAVLTGPGGLVAITGLHGTPPADWSDIVEFPGVQMVCERPAATGPATTGPTGVGDPADEVVALGDGDVEDMLRLVGLARPGPFLPRTIEFGGYLGIRRDGELVAMAGERLRLPGWTEISAVATHPDHRGQGLGTVIVHAVVATVVRRGECPFLHAAAGNTVAIRLYQELGFSVRQETLFVVARAPDTQARRPPSSAP